MIDWSDPEPDALKPQGVPLRTMADAVALLDQWIAAYDRLEREANYLEALLRSRDNYKG